MNTMKLRQQPEHTVTWSKARDIEGVMIGTTGVEGPNAAVFANVHADEPAGGEVVDQLPHKIKTLAGGTLYAVHANLEAMKVGKRQTESNLNRAFREGIEPTTYEERRAAELMEYFAHMGKDDALLDLHGYEDPDGTPFIIAERESLEVARAIGPEVIAFGFAEAEPGGTDDWGHRLGLRAAICYEIGSMDVSGYNAAVERGYDAVERMLRAIGMKHGYMPPEHENPMLVEVSGDSAYIRKGDTFSMTRRYASFERLEPNEHVATDGDVVVRADDTREQVMIFPKPTAPDIGREAFALGYVVEQ